jgi:hypothetical protein
VAELAPIVVAMACGGRGQDGDGVRGGNETAGRSRM